MSYSIPLLGSTEEEVIESAYLYGYDEFDQRHLRKELEDEEVIPEGSDFPHHDLMNSEWYQGVVLGGSTSRNLTHAIDDFVENHTSEEFQQRYEREHAVVEDVYSAYEGGAMDALLNNGKDKDRVSHLSIPYEL